MPTASNGIADKKLHPNAKSAIRNYSSQFTEAVLLTSKIIADREGSDDVQTVHVDEARKIYLTLSQKEDRRWQAKLAGSFFFLGISFTGLCSEFASASLRPNWMLFFIAAGVTGLLFFAWSVSSK